MSEDYTPPRVWTWGKANGGQFANINRPVSGATHERALPVGEHPFQLYSQGTPNGQKATILLEELIEAGYPAEYDGWLVKIGEGEQFSSGFVDINPNSKIPALLDLSGHEPVRVFESGAILLHLAEKFGAFIPADPTGRAECLAWLFWQVGSAPLIGGGFGHFYAYAPTKIEYAIDRYAMETKRLWDVADKRLAQSRFLAGENYTIADIAVYAWFGALAKEAYGNAAEFLALHEYGNVQRWIAEIDARPGAQRGRLVNRPGQGLDERHSASDFTAFASAGNPAG
jgi:GST-like protein